MFTLIQVPEPVVIYTARGLAMLLKKLSSALYTPVIHLDIMYSISSRDTNVHRFLIHSQLPLFLFAKLLSVFSCERRGRA